MPSHRFAFTAPLLAGLLLASATPRPVVAQDSQQSRAEADDDRARASFRLARQFYESGDFAAAGPEFERAYGLSGRSELLYNAYLAYRDARDDENAARVLRGYLDTTVVEDRELLAARLAVLESALAERRAAEEAEATNAARIVVVPEARYREYPGEDWPWYVAAGGAALLVAGAVTGAVAMTQRDALDQDCPLGLCPAGYGLDGRRDETTALAVSTDVLLVTGGVAAVTGLVLGIVFLPRRERIEDSPVSFGCSSSGCVGAVRGEF